MEQQSAICPKCHTQVRTSDYFCFNCGTNLKPVPPSTSAQAQIILYLKSILLPPFGVYWSIAYFKQKDAKSKAVGFIAIAVTLVALAILFILTNSLVKNINEQVNSQLNLMQF
jgi:hypothetical protein